MAVAPTGIISSLGVGSGLDVNSIVSQLMTVEQQPLTLLNQKETDFQAKLSAFGTLRGALSSFQSSVQSLDSLDKFQTFTATGSNPAVLTATAGTGAASGAYSFNVTQTAQAQSLEAVGQTTTTAAIGSGSTTTLTFDFGTISGGLLTAGVYSGATFNQDASQGSGTVTIDSSNNSLQGIRDAINAANIGVSASIIKDGSSAPNRLVLTNTATGAAHSVRVSVSGDSALQTLLGYNPAGTQNLKQSVAAQDAALTINGLSITSASNTVTGALEGVSLSLAGPGTTTVTVGRDSSAVKTAIQGFVKAYNDLNGTLHDLTKFDPTTLQAGTLIGESSVLTIQNQIRNALSATLGGVDGSSLKTLSQAGIAFQRDGTLAIDTTKLSAALSGNLDDLAALFTSVGRSTDSLIQFSGSTGATQAGKYSVNVTALATQGTVAGSAPAGTTITAGVNDQLNFTVDGVSSSVTVAAGIYTAATLATQVQAAINGAAALSAQGVSVAVTQSGGVLSITSSSFGSNSSVSASGSAAATAFGGVPVSSAGTDVAGTIDGAPAGGSRQVLTATSSGASGLAIVVTGGSVGARGSINFSRGYARGLNDLIDSLLSTSGLIAGSTDGINSTIKDLDDQRGRLNDRLVSIKARYVQQFTALDSLISSMQTTSSFLTQQLAQLPKAGG
jgi:flagellar hook-associated protein 2